MSRINIFCNLSARLCCIIVNSVLTNMETNEVFCVRIINNKPTSYLNDTPQARSRFDRITHRVGEMAFQSK